MADKSITYKNYQISGPFTIYSNTSGQCNIYIGDDDSLAEEADYNVSFVSSEHPICHLGIQLPYSMPVRYIEESVDQKSPISEGQEKIVKNLFNNEKPHIYHNDSEELRYYMPRRWISNGNIVSPYDSRNGDIYISGRYVGDYSSITEDNGTIEQTFTISENGVLELDLIQGYDWKIWFLHSVPDNTIIDVIWRYETE